MQQALETAKTLAVTSVCIGGTVLCCCLAGLVNRTNEVVKNANVVVVKVGSAVSDFRLITSSLTRICEEYEKNSDDSVVKTAKDALKALIAALNGAKQVDSVLVQLEQFIATFNSKLPELTGAVVDALRGQGFVVKITK